LGFDDFSCLLLTILSIKLMSPSPTRDVGYLSSQTYFCPAASAARSRLLKKSGDAKRMVRIHFDLTFLQFFYSPFFQLNCHIQCERAISDIAAHRRMFSSPPPPPARVDLNRVAMRKEW
jgi:hypothetical protein